MLQVLTKAAAFVSIIILGYVLKRIKVFDKKDFYIISRIVIKITLPAAIISNFSKISMEPSLMILCLIGFLCNVFTVLAVFLMKTGKPKEEKAFNMLNSSGYNIGNFTMPFVQSFLGPVGFAATSLFDAGNAIMCVGGTRSAAVAVLGNGEKTSVKNILKSLLSSVPFDAYVVMTIITLLKIELPVVFLTFTDTIGGANAFLALFMIGIGFDIHADKKKISEMVKILATRYTIAVVLSICFYKFMPFEHEIRKALAIIVLGPVASAAPAYTGELGGDIELSSAINSASIIISIVAISMALIILQ